MNPSSLFGLSDHLEALSRHGDPLEVLDATVDFEYFRGWLVEGLGYGDGSKPPVSGKLSAALLFSIFQVGGIGH